VTEDLEDKIVGNEYQSEEKTASVAAVKEKRFTVFQRDLAASILYRI